eukprot:6081270-Pyramimonas_sp.AAC.1
MSLPAPGPTKPCATAALRWISSERTSSRTLHSTSSWSPKMAGKFATPVNVHTASPRPDGESFLSFGGRRHSRR